MEPIMNENKPYHLRRQDKDITSRQEILDILKTQQILTMAMCRDNEPYLVTLDYGYNESENCFYIHCAKEGKKLDFLRANPRVWGQVLEDRGYANGQCEHAFRCVMFEAFAEYLQGADEMLRALGAMVDKFEPGNTSLKERLVTKSQLSKLSILRLRVTSMTCKQSPAPAKE